MKYELTVDELLESLEKLGVDTFGIDIKEEEEV